MKGALVVRESFWRALTGQRCRRADKATGDKRGGGACRRGGRAAAGTDTVTDPDRPQLVPPYVSRYATGQTVREAHEHTHVPPPTTGHRTSALRATGADKARSRIDMDRHLPVARSPAPR
eukprot:7165549-Prymnesium_polylepis.2